MKRHVRNAVLLVAIWLLAMTPTLAQQHHGATSYNRDLYGPDARALSLSNDRADEESSEGRFGRMFPLGESLRPHPSPIYDLRRLGRDNGPMVDESGQAGDSTVHAGITFLGQFVDHDITLDISTRLDRPAIASDVENNRTSNLDLDCVYGSGPEGSPFLYDLPKLVVGNDLGQPNRYDLARFNGVALIGDARNDENAIVSQIQAAFIAFHNAVADALVERSGSTIDNLSSTQKREIFEMARDHVIHYYHRLLAEDFLPNIIGVDRTLITVAASSKATVLSCPKQP